MFIKILYVCASAVDSSASSMLRYQDSLPHLPVPNLAQSLEKYVSAVTPIVSAEELARTRKLAAEFSRPGGVGETLQEKLLSRAKVTDNWVCVRHWVSCIC